MPKARRSRYQLPKPRQRSGHACLRASKDKFRLFDGIFGSSDEVLGALESGVDFEGRIAEIYQTCRTSSEIDGAFKQLQLDLDEQISREWPTPERNYLRTLTTKSEEGSGTV